MATKALELIRALNDPACTFVGEAAKKVRVLNAACLPDFTQADLDFFGLNDARTATPADLYEPDFFKLMTPANPLDRATKVAISVLVKSAAALLVDQHLAGVPDTWRVLAAPHHSPDPEVCFRSVLGEQLPFDVGTDIHVKRLEERSEDFFVVYTTRHFVLFLYFAFSGDTNFARRVGRAMVSEEGSLMKWEGSRLMEMSVSPSPWQEVFV